ncbi:hypothetical protein H8S95_07000 [Pontibacter sp. KCTC 32443]|uniref:hypothetical protein n=1 Tax=Pontibacter TaxID=323449 RepID=UPI00164D2972|nr:MULTISPECIES: hypothetical protein [Pontibacter]MBC5773805.1 hypothetical protein [Pontibacter sp. KCTC 32443]
MRKTILLICFCITSGGAFAQLQSGSVYTGATMGGNYKKEADIKSSGFNINPSVGYFVSSNWMIGIQSQFEISKTQTGEIKTAPTNSYTYPSQTQVNEKTTTWGLGAMVRFYQPVSNKFAFFIEGNAGINTTRYKVDVKQQAAGFPTNNGGIPPFLGSTYYRDQNGKIILNADGSYYTGNDPLHPETKQNSTYGNVAPGIVFFPVPKVGIELKLNAVTYTKQEDTEADISADFNLTRTTIGAGIYF